MDEEQVPALPSGIDGALRRADVWAEPPAGLQAQVFAALRAEVAAAAGSTPATAPVTTPATASAPTPVQATAAAPPPATAPPATDEFAAARDRRARRTDRRAGWFRPRTLVLAAVAASVLVVGGLAVAAQRGSDATVVTLAGTELQAGAEGTASITDTPSGFRIELDVSGLPPAAPGTYYQAWVKGEQGLVTIGTFHGREGTDDVVLWSGVDLAKYPLLTVTLQQEGAGAESSGQVVLSGPIPPVD